MLDGGTYPLFAVCWQPQAEGDFVGRKETDTIEIARQPVRIIADNLDYPA